MKAHKICYKCHRNKHISQFYSKSNRCRNCYNEIANIHLKIKRKINYYSNKQRICQICNSEKQTLELANIENHIYSENPADYILLCSKCHYLYDSLTKSRNGFFELDKSIYQKQTKRK